MSGSSARGCGMDVVEVFKLEQLLVTRHEARGERGAKASPVHGKQGRTVFEPSDPSLSMFDEQTGFPAAEGCW